MVSRQREWQKKQVAKGNCSSCGKPRGVYALLCDECGIKHRRRQRKNPNSPLRRGRPPFVEE